ncbi:hypothetical protein LCGC14_2027660 [marine sediment metagenome]|uniref:Yeast cell wall synthesis Kre9/Knh1-like N-terminal domain-containing protein n=1 Tax=marine sediment metagenome TaxID=412755 RepID=A0A0F9FI49_9ZZZZ
MISKKNKGLIFCLVVGFILGQHVYFQFSKSNSNKPISDAGVLRNSLGGTTLYPTWYTYDSGWAADHISWSFSTNPLVVIEVYAMTLEQFSSFHGVSVKGTLLSDCCGVASGDFTVPFEGRWFIVFWYHTPGDSTYITYDTDFYGDNRPPQITILSPTSSDKYFTESQKSIQWSSINAGSTIKLELFKGNSLISVISSSTFNDGIAQWTIAESYSDGEDYKIKVTSISTGVYDFSEEFTIYKRQILVYDPRNTDVLAPHTTYLIEWFSRGTSSKVKLDLYLNSTYLLEITNETEDDFYFTWNVWQGKNYSTITDSHYQIRVQDYVTPKYFDFSSEFTITSERFLKILTPVVNSSYNSGQIMDITWETDSSAEYVSINLMRDNANVLQISPSTENTGSLEWRIPSNLKSDSNYTLLINATDNSAHAYSEIFTIKAIDGISGYSLPLLITGIILIGLCVFLLNHKKILSYGR